MIKTTVNIPEMCECGRLYKDRRDENGKMMCSACYSNCDVETLNKCGIDPPSEKIPVRYVNVNGREEHEAILRDSKKMWELGLDPGFEKMVYLKRWGSWLNGCTSYDGKL